MRVIPCRLLHKLCRARTCTRRQRAIGAAERGYTKHHVGHFFLGNSELGINTAKCHYTVLHYFYSFGYINRCRRSLNQKRDGSVLITYIRTNGLVYYKINTTLLIYDPSLACRPRFDSSRPLALGPFRGFNTLVQKRAASASGRRCTTHVPSAGVTFGAQQKRFERSLRSLRADRKSTQEKRSRRTHTGLA